ncbi:ABC transporter permease [uncultured Dysosmobacter sp.]|uniref:ABC transporter permease n=1 Tax=uncultured Dysosmobacter sp. TaxID=2591384 RepID=UPI00262F51B6|nr:ABC transporter permease [uncultured Dysosmobacter sp.]
MNIRQAIKMAWKSILGKKGRSMLTMLGIIIGIGAVMTIVSAMNGYKEKTMEQYKAMGSDQLQVSIYSWMYDEDGNSLAPDYFPDLYDYCVGLEGVVGVTPNSRSWDLTVSYGTKNSSNMQDYQVDEKGNVVGDMPPNVYLVSDQYSMCRNLTIARGRDLSVLDTRNYNQVCVLGARAAKTFFGSADPVGKTMQVNGCKFDVVGVYASRIEGEDYQSVRVDNFIILPYTARRVLGGEQPTDFIVKCSNSDVMMEVKSKIEGFLKGLVDRNTGDAYVDMENSWQQYEAEQMGMISLVLGGIAAISLLVGGIGIMNIMLVTVTERTREIGIRRAIGAQRSSIVTQFLMEAAMLCGIGGILGIGLGTAGSVIAGRLMFQMTIYPAVWITVCAFSLSVALGIIFGIYPAVKAANLQPVEALRAE